MSSKILNQTKITRKSGNFAIKSWLVKHFPRISLMAYEALMQFSWDLVGRLFMKFGGLTHYMVPQVWFTSCHALSNSPAFWALIGWAVSAHLQMNCWSDWTEIWWMNYDPPLPWLNFVHGPLNPCFNCLPLWFTLQQGMCIHWCLVISYFMFRYRKK